MKKGFEESYLGAKITRNFEEISNEHTRFNRKARSGRIRSLVLTLGTYGAAIEDAKSHVPSIQTRLMTGFSSDTSSSASFSLPSDTSAASTSFSSPSSVNSSNLMTNNISSNNYTARSNQAGANSPSRTQQVAGYQSAVNGSRAPQLSSGSRNDGTVSRGDEGIVNIEAMKIRIVKQLFSCDSSMVCHKEVPRLMIKALEIQLTKVIKSLQRFSKARFDRSRDWLSAKLVSDPKASLQFLEKREREIGTRQQQERKRKELESARELQQKQKKSRGGIDDQENGHQNTHFD